MVIGRGVSWVCWGPFRGHLGPLGHLAPSPIDLTLLRPRLRHSRISSLLLESLQSHFFWTKHHRVDLVANKYFKFRIFWLVVSAQKIVDQTSHPLQVSYSFIGRFWTPC